MHAGEEDSTSLNYSQTAKIPKPLAAKPYFNCDHYAYFPGDNTILSTDDSLALFSYATSVKVEYSRDPAVHAKEFSKLANFLPRVWHTVDDVWYDKLMLDKNSKARFKSLNWVDLAAIINSEAIIVGKIIDVQNHIDTTQCYYFKSTFYIKVKEVINSSFPLEEGDIVMIKHGIGYMGGCSNNPMMYTSANMGQDYKKGESNVFFLQHYKYKAWFVKLRQDKKKKARFDDTFCKNAFIIPFNNYKYDISNKALLEDIKRFFAKKDILLTSLFPKKKLVDKDGKVIEEEKN